MYDRLLKRMRELIRTRQYIMSLHAEDEMEADGLTIFEERPMVCDMCGKSGAVIRQVSRSYGKGANLFVIENVPIVSCPHGQHGDAHVFMRIYFYTEYRNACK